jgi:hypothetical protein
MKLTSVEELFRNIINSDDRLKSKTTFLKPNLGL